jgi:hypothetical protein
MKKISNYLLLSLLVVSLLSCKKDEDKPKNDQQFPGSTFISDQSTATEEILRSIPVEYINKARNELHIAYQHTSHGTHVSYGMFGLPDYKDGDDILFGITNNDPQTGKLDFRDYAMDFPDLSQSNEKGFIQATRDYLDNPDNAEINVIMWSWCSISGHDVEGNYLPGMEDLIEEYGVGGSKIGNDAGQRENPVTFIFMTGHAETNNVGDGRPKNQAQLITDYCNLHHQFCLDYYSIDTHNMNGNYYEDADDNGGSATYGGNFYKDFQDAHSVGNGYYENRTSPGGTVEYGNHNDQHITANRKAYAMWYILARIAGWDGEF